MQLILLECQTVWIQIGTDILSSKDRHSVGPDLGLNSLQRLSTEDKKTSLARKEFDLCENQNCLNRFIAR